MSFKENDRVEYAHHHVHTQANGSFIHPPTRTEHDRLVAQGAYDGHPDREALVNNPQVQDWRPATVVRIINHGPGWHDTASEHGCIPKSEDDIVVQLMTDEGLPRDINIKLVRYKP